MHEITTTRTYGQGERLTTATTLTVRPRVTQDTATDKARANWTRADWKFFRKLARREGWT